MIVFIAPNAVQAGASCHGYRRRVVTGLVDDQVGDDARIGIDNVAALAEVRIGDQPAGAWTVHIELIAVLVVAEERIEQPREQVVGGAELGLIHIGEIDQVVERAIHRPQAERQP